MRDNFMDGMGSAFGGGFWTVSFGADY